MPNTPVPAAATGLPDTYYRIPPNTPEFWKAAAYGEFLFTEMRMLNRQLCLPYEEACLRTMPGLFHFPTGGGWRDVPQPSTRAMDMLTFAGVDVARLDAWAHEQVKEWEAAR